MGQTYRVMGTSSGYQQRGFASWYGPGFHGKLTASGEVYEMDKYTAAHRTLPLGTYVRVKRLDGKGDPMVVRINDRGPFVDDRIIDLSRAAARQLEMLDDGVAEVEVVALGEGGKITRRKKEEVVLTPRKDYSYGSFAVQVGAFTVRDNALRLVKRMKSDHGFSEMTRYNRGDAVFYRVRVGSFKTETEATVFRDQLIDSGEFNSAFVVAR
jgi:rare lipoprotein A